MSELPTIMTGINLKRGKSSFPVKISKEVAVANAPGSSVMENSTAARELRVINSYPLTGLIR